MFGLTKILGGDHPPSCGYDPENLPFKKIQWDNLSTQHKSYTMFLEFRKALGSVVKLQKYLAVNCACSQ